MSFFFLNLVVISFKPFVDITDYFFHYYLMVVWIGAIYNYTCSICI